MAQKICLLFIQLAFFCQYSIAFGEVYSNFTEQKQDKLACTIGQAMLKYNTDKGVTFQQKMSDVKNRLREIDKFSDAIHLPQNYFGYWIPVYSNLDYFTDLGFLEFDKVDLTTSENWFGNYAYYLHLVANGNVMEVFSRNGDLIERYVIPKELVSELNSTLTFDHFESASKTFVFKSGNDSNLVHLSLESLNESEKIFPAYKNVSLKDYLKRFSEYTTNHKWIIDRDLYRIRGKIIENPSSPNWSNLIYSGWEGEISPLSMIENSGSKEALATALHKASELASPLYEKLLDAPPFYYSLNDLFLEALRIYESPYVALGVIAWVGSMESLLIKNRLKRSMIGYKVQPILMVNDLMGTQYHFWGYLLRTVYGQGTRFTILSTGLENLLEGDSGDWHADMLAISVGEKVLEIVNGDGRCN